MNMTEILKNINDMVAEFNELATKRIEKGNASAGMKSRKITTAIAKMMKEWRAESVKKD